MSCNREQFLQKEFDDAVSARIQAEARSLSGLDLHAAGEVRDARTKEDKAQKQRMFHISGCRDCWASASPPMG
jgi:hypothetical protein